MTSRAVADLWLEAASAAPDAPALVDDDTGDWVSHAALVERSARWRAAIGDVAPKPLAFVMTESRVDVVAAWLGAWRAGAAVGFVNPLLKEGDLDALVRTYEPDCIVMPASSADPDGYAARPVAGTKAARLCVRSDRAGPEPHRELALLLFTSGTTGSPKAVRLSTAGLGHNTSAIVASLGLAADERALGHLHLSYSFGMSVVNTHLAAGGSVVLTSGSLANPALWKRASALGVTTLPGVPAQYELLYRLHFDVEKFCPSMRVMTQAGGKTREEVLRYFGDMMKRNRGRFYVMYGQTEAGPRMACQELTGSAGDPTAAGWPLADGAFEILDEDARPRPTGEAGSVRYRGPNVMMGYAECRADLARGDDSHGVLDTGDVGHLGADGKLFIIGRSKRFAKVGGIRCSLDEIERVAAGLATPVAVLPADDSIVVFWQEDSVDDPRRAGLELARTLAFPATAVRCRLVDAIPRLESGKTDYAALRELEAGGS